MGNRSITYLPKVYTYIHTYIHCIYLKFIGFMSTVEVQYDVEAK